MLGAMRSALDVIAQALENGDETRFIFSEKDFLYDCVGEDGHVANPERLKEMIGDVIVMSNEADAKLFSKRLADQNIDYFLFDVIKNDPGKNPFNQDEHALTTGSIPETYAKLETWIIPSKEHNDRSRSLFNAFLKSEKEKRIDMDRLIKASKSPVRPFELTMVKNVNNHILRAMESSMHTAPFYSIVEGPVTSSVVLPSASINKFMQNMLSTIATRSGSEKNVFDFSRNEMFEYENKYLPRTVDDRKPFFIADLQPDDTFKEGVVIDKQGARRLIFAEDKTYVVESYSRNSNFFDAYAAYLIGRYQNPGYVELNGSNIQRDDIIKAQGNIVRDRSIKEPNPAKEMAISQKNYLIQNFIAPAMLLEISNTSREEALSRIGNAKWHALENGLYCEAQELGKDEAEGHAASTPRNRNTMRGIDLNTVDHEGFDLKDDLYYATREELGRAIGLNESEISRLTSVVDARLDNIIRSDPEVKRETLHEIGEFYNEIRAYRDTEYAELLPNEIEQMLSLDRELTMELDRDVPAHDRDEMEPEI